MSPRTLDRLILRIKSPEVLVGQAVTEMSEDNKEKPPYQAQRCDSGSCSIHPILKKPDTAHKAHPVESESHKSARLLLDTPIGTKIMLEPSNSPTRMASPTPIPDPRPTPKKTYLTATRTGRGPRRRPVFNRRKSSQTSIPKSPSTAAAAAAPRRRSEPAVKPDRSDAMYEDSYVELGLLQHLSFRDEEDQIARDLGREIAPEPKPEKPSVPLFDEVDDDIPLPDPNAKISAVPFPRAASLKHPTLSSEDLGRVKQSFDVQDLGSPGPKFEIDDIDGDWTDVDALDSTLPISQPFKNIVEHHEIVADKTCSAINSDIVPAVVSVDKSTLMPPTMESVKL
ncbi:unnamed protein product [Penicillium olsonii]|nr:unnamed protein product [Penicillium olsonii]